MTIRDCGHQIARRQYVAGHRGFRNLVAQIIKQILHRHLVGDDDGDIDFSSLILASLFVLKLCYRICARQCLPSSADSKY